MNFLENMLDNLSNSFDGFLPTTIAAILILIIGSIIAGFIKRIITKVVKKTKVDDKLGSGKPIISTLVGKLVYLFIMIFVFMLALEKLGMTGVLEPVKNLLNGFTDFIPNIVGAGLVGYIGYMLANIVSELVGLSGDTISNLAPKLRLPENLDLVGILKKIVFIFIFIPLLITALNILNMDAISVPATDMLQQFFTAIPKILVAVIIIVLFVVGGKFVAGLLTDLLESLNLNSIVNKMDLGDATSKTNLPKVIGNIAYFFIVLFGITTALEKLEFTKLTEVLDTIVGMSGNILFGLIILLIGNTIASMAHKAMTKSSNNAFVASIARMCILALFLAMGLKSMGIGDEIVNLAFGITLATVAVTIALSFGLGGREAAGKQMERLLDKFNDKK